MPQSRWFGASSCEIKEFLATATEEALLRMLAKLEASAIKTDSVKLRSDLRQALAEFLKWN